ncbi:hypothetical protein VM1G_09086 [Cytospora mali]|uniref:Uncharacterized protein n=1 Tax=Cytospora mali TaxID=578113 RepID=A0A194WAV3_CYTMA|nr:hypothetical protein VM1G_09086 [Valsa mali]
MNDVVIDNLGDETPRDVQELITKHIQKARTPPPLGEDKQAIIRQKFKDVWDSPAPTVSDIIDTAVMESWYNDAALQNVRSVVPKAGHFGELAHQLLLPSLIIKFSNRTVAKRLTTSKPSNTRVTPSIPRHQASNTVKGVTSNAVWMLFPTGVDAVDNVVDAEVEQNGCCQKDSQGYSEMQGWIPIFLIVRLSRAVSLDELPKNAIVAGCSVGVTSGYAYEAGGTNHCLLDIVDIRVMLDGHLRRILFEDVAMRVE